MYKRQLSELRDEEIHVGDFFNKVDREYLREEEKTMLLLNENADLIPGLHLPVPTQTHLSDSDFESNGSSSVSFLTPIATSTPVRPALELDLEPDSFVIGSPLNSSIGSVGTRENEKYT